MTPELKPLNLPKSIDEHAAEYDALKSSADAAAKLVKEKKDELLKLVRRDGKVPAGAEKSLRLQGDKWDITASFGTSSSIDNDVVGEIQAQLARDRKPSVFRKLFQTNTSYLVSPQAQAVLSGCSAAVRKLFARVVTTKPKEPSLRVERRKK